MIACTICRDTDIEAAVTITVEYGNRGDEQHMYAVCATCAELGQDAYLPVLAQRLMAELGA